jgi:hypothetical protein
MSDTRDPEAIATAALTLRSALDPYGVLTLSLRFWADAIRVLQLVEAKEARMEARLRELEASVTIYRKRAEVPKR